MRVTRALTRGTRLLLGLVVVLASAGVLVLEVLSVRLVAPYVGLTLETYTAGIGVALGAIAVGAFAGGVLADRVDPRRTLGPALIVGGLLVLLARPLVHLLGPRSPLSGPAEAVMLVGVAVVAPVIVLSSVSPGVVRLLLGALAESGRVAGRVSALGTLGALAGTFGTGFVLLAALPTSGVLGVTAAVLVGTGLAVTAALGGGTRGLVVPVLAGVLPLSLLGSLALVRVDGPCQAETAYYCARVAVDQGDPSLRSLYLDDLHHARVDLDEPGHLVFSYTRRFRDAAEATLPPGPVRALHLGGGGFTFPRALRAERPGSQSTVLEVDPSVVRIAREQLGLVTGPDLVVREGDGRVLVAAEPSGTYDLVVGDAFGSIAVPWHLATREAAQDLRRVLRPGGVYVLNLIDYGPLDFLRAEVATLRAVWPHVALLATPGQVVPGDGSGGNIVVVASDNPLPVADLLARAAPRGEPGGVVDELATAALAAGAQVLTDDRAPVDQLFTPAVRR